jgi:hypothetical protein
MITFQLMMYLWMEQRAEMRVEEHAFWRSRRHSPMFSLVSTYVYAARTRIKYDVTSESDIPLYDETLNPSSRRCQSLINRRIHISGCILIAYACDLTWGLRDLTTRSGIATSVWAIDSGRQPVFFDTEVRKASPSAPDAKTERFHSSPVRPHLSAFCLST